MAYTNNKPSPSFNDPMMRHSHLIWLDANIDLTKKEYSSAIGKLHQVGNNVKTFTDMDECVDYITDMNERVSVIISNDFNQIISSILPDLPQLNSVYIFNENNLPYGRTDKEWTKSNDVYTNVTLICETLKRATKDCDSSAVSMDSMEKTDSFVEPVSETLDCTFIYTQIMKEILLTISFNEKDIHAFRTYYCEHFDRHDADLRIVHNIDANYYNQTPFQWYAKNSFMHSLVNQALRSMELDLIVKTGFFIRDLHNAILTLHLEQKNSCPSQRAFTVYRGQILSLEAFSRLKRRLGGLLLFSCFVSTSLDRAIALTFAQSVTCNPELIGIVFEMHIDPLKYPSIFARIDHISPFPDEVEILFSTHTTYRIGELTQLDNTGRLWEVKMTLVDNKDSQMETLMQIIHKEVEGPTSSFRMGQLMKILGRYHGAQKMFEISFDETSDEDHKGKIYCQMGSIKMHEGRYAEALAYYEKAIEIQENTLCDNHLDMATSYNNIGVVFYKMGDYSKAYLFYRKALAIRRKTQLRNHSDLATSYINIALLYRNVGKYSEALSYYENALQIQQYASLPNHPNIAKIYNNIGIVCDSIGQHSKAFSLYQKAIQVNESVLPGNHHHFAIPYNNIGGMYYTMGEYSKALSFCRKAAEIQEKLSGENHPDLASCYNNIGVLHSIMKEYSKALSFYEKALQIQQKSLPHGHRDLARPFNNIGSAYCKMMNYPQALAYFKKALEIEKAALHENHPHLVIYYNNIGVVLKKMSMYSEALEFYQNALQDLHETFVPNCPDLATYYNNIGTVHYNMSEYPKALSFFWKALEIRQQSLHPNHLCFAISYINIGLVYDRIGQHSKALEFYQRAVDMQEEALSNDHPDITIASNNTGKAYYSMDEHSRALLFNKTALEIQERTLPENHSDSAPSDNYSSAMQNDINKFSEALRFYEKTVAIEEKKLPPNYPDLARLYNNVGGICYYMGEYSKAISYYQRALEIKEEIFPTNHPDLITAYNNIGGVYYSMGEYLEASLFYQKAVELQEKIPSGYDFPSSRRSPASRYGEDLQYNDPQKNDDHFPDTDLIIKVDVSKAGMFSISFAKNNYSGPISFCKEELDVQQEKPFLDDPDLVANYNNTGAVYQDMDQCSKALLYYQKLLKIQQKIFPPNHRELAVSYHNIAAVYYRMGEYSKAALFYEQALNIERNKLTQNDADLSSSCDTSSLSRGTNEKAKSQKNSIPIEIFRLKTIRPKSWTCKNTTKTFVRTVGR